MTDRRNDNLPRVAVAPDPFVLGVRDRETLAQCGRLALLPFEDAFLLPHDTDAHLVMYSAVENGQVVDEGWPRINKPFLPTLRQEGVSLHATLLLLDYDRPGHQDATWSEDHPEEARKEADRIIGRFSSHPILSQWSLVYPTRAGLRLVFVPDQMIPVTDAEGCLQWMAQASHRLGVSMDQRVFDWTRLFRLPDVLRDGVQQGTQSWFFVEFQPDRRVSSELLLRESQIQAVPEARILEATIQRHSSRMPDPDQARSLLEVPSPRTGKMVETEFVRTARRELRGRDCYACLFEHQDLATIGKRDSTLTQYVGQAVNQLFGLPGTSPEHIYALFLTPVLCLEPDQQTPRWDVSLWDKICRFWGLEQAKADTRARQKAREMEDAGSLEDRILAGVASWCDDPEFDATPRDGETQEQARDRRSIWLSRRMILSMKSGYHILKPDGYYDDLGVSKDHLVARIRELGMDPAIPTTENRNGVIKPRPATDIIADHVKVLSRVEGVPQTPGTVLIGNSARVCMYRRNPSLEPEFDPEVDQWLHTLFGDMVDRGLAWIGHALAFEDGAICALSIRGASGCGKKLLAVGLSECLENPVLADATELVDKTQYGLAQSPFLVVNEGWPIDRTGRPIDRFRQVVGGDPITIRRKYVDDMVARSPLRVIMSANDGNVVDGLIQGQFMGPDDREAVGIRILHIDVGDEASRWLRAKGGMDFTGRPGRRWIGGDGGQASDFILARHFLWLWQNRKPRENRLLVEGNGLDALGLEMSSQSGHSPDVYRALVGMLEHRRPPMATWGKGLVVDRQSGRAWTVPSAVFDYFAREMKGTPTASDSRLSLKTVAKVLQSLDANPAASQGYRRREYSIDGFESRGRKVWVELDLLPILEVARNYGLDCDRLTELVENSMNR